MKKRVWMITGASSGFGRAIAEAALAAGDTVAAAVRRPEAVKDLVELAPGRIGAFQFDITDQSQIQPLVDEVVSTYGHIDVLVNNAGRGLVGAGEETTDAELRDLMELHFFGPVALTRAVLPYMRAQKSGTVVQMSSQGGRFSFPGVGAYSATKFALEGWTEAVAQEVEPFGVRCVIVEPGAFRTSFNTSNALLISTPSETYSDSVGVVARGLTDANGKEPGDPVKAAAAILQVVDSNNPPLRLPLGSDAADAVSVHLSQLEAEFQQWQELTRSTDF